MAGREYGVRVRSRAFAVSTLVLAVAISAMLGPGLDNAVVAIAVAGVAAGLLAGLLGVGGGIIIVPTLDFAFAMFGVFELQLPSSLQTRLSTASGKQRAGTFLGTFVMGALSALVVLRKLRHLNLVSVLKAPE